MDHLPAPDVIYELENNAEETEPVTIQEIRDETETRSTTRYTKKNDEFSSNTTENIVQWE